MSNAPKNPIPATSERAAKYLNNGLTVMSNNSAVHPRDEAGNIVLRESSTTNPLLIIEPAVINYTLRSFVKSIDTSFRYYKFPTTTYNTVNDVNLTIDKPNFDPISYKQPAPPPPPEDPFIDDISTRMVIPPLDDGTLDGATYIRAATTERKKWYDQKTETQGFRALPFQGGNDPFNKHSFLIKQSMIDSLKKHKKLLKFKFKSQFRAEPQDKFTGFTVRLTVTDEAGWLGNYHMPLLTAVAPGKDGAGGVKPDGVYPFLGAEMILHPDDLRENQLFTIEAVATNNSWLMSPSCKWFIDVIDEGSEGKFLLSLDASKPKSGVTSVESGYGNYFPTTLFMRGSSVAFIQNDKGIKRV